MDPSTIPHLSIVQSAFSIPHLAELRSQNPVVSKRAWAVAYPVLHDAGHAVARITLAGGQWAAEREDCVLTAMEQLLDGIVENKSKSYNGMTIWDDVLSMMRTITRRRITDFLRQRGRRPLDYVEILPEPAIPSAPDYLPFTAAELWAAVAELEPDPPVPDLFRDRFQEGWNTTEIAARRNLNVNTVLTHFAKGFRSLKEKLSALESITYEKGTRP